MDWNVPIFSDRQGKNIQMQNKKLELFDLLKQKLVYLFCATNT